MQHYLDIQLSPDPEMGTHVLLEDVFGRIHRALATTSISGVAVSFPKYQAKPIGLGDVVRLIGNADQLDALMSRASGVRLPAGMASVASMATVPVAAEHRQLRRVQAKSSPARLRRRQMRRRGISEDEAIARLPDSAAERLTLPFVGVRSASTGQRFRLFLTLSAPVAPVAGPFNAYGLSAIATVPWF